MITAEKLATELEDLLGNIPPYHSYEHEEEAWDEAQESAKKLLAEWKIQNDRYLARVS